MLTCSCVTVAQNLAICDNFLSPSLTGTRTRDPSDVRAVSIAIGQEQELGVKLKQPRRRPFHIHQKATVTRLLAREKRPENYRASVAGATEHNDRHCAAQPC